MIFFFFLRIFEYAYFACFKRTPVRLFVRFFFLGRALTSPDQDRRVSDIIQYRFRPKNTSADAPFVCVRKICSLKIV